MVLFIIICVALIIAAWFSTKKDLKKDGLNLNHQYEFLDRRETVRGSVRMGMKKTIFDNLEELEKDISFPTE